MSSSPDRPPRLDLDGLCFGWPEAPLFDGLSARLAPGVVLVLGGDGRGKTTLLRLIAGELRPQAGAVRLDGRTPDDDPAAWRRAVLSAEAGAQAHEQRTPNEVFAEARRRWPAFDEAALAGLVEGLSLAPHLDKRFFMLSTGSRRKALFAAALAARAPVTLLDGPFAALDRPSSVALLHWMADLAVRADRVLVVSGYEAPEGVHASAIVDLGD